MDGWLSLKVLEHKTSGRKVRQGSLLIVIPKKVIGLAVDRNRLKRLIREAVRLEGLKQTGLIYQFRVLRRPEKAPRLSDAQKIIRDLTVR